MIDPLYIFVFAGLFSPGPNVIMVTTSGARFGIKATIPHVLGIAIGVGITAGLTGLGIGAIVTNFPTVTLVLKIVAATWILWMAYGMITKARSSKQAGPDAPFSFIQAVLFQWVNPKIWAIALAASAGYSIGLSPSGEAVRLATAFAGINLCVCLFWTFAGSLLTLLLKSDKAWSIFLGIMGVALAASALMIFI
ncbi:MAG: LysE family translocator [Paracoccaceae bacterium]|nr:LysE family translocator [Paracoccaceae bacterium]